MIHSTLLMHFVRLDIESHCGNVHQWIHQYYQSFAQASTFQDPFSWTFAVEESGSAHEFQFDHTLTGGHCLNLDLAGMQLQCSINDKIVGRGQGQFPSAVEIDFATRTVKANIAGDLAKFSDCFVYGLFRTILRLFVMPASGVFMPHGAMVTKQGRTFFLAGASGTGKSTTSLQLLQHGFSIISDDSPLVCLSDGRAYALSSLDDFCILENVLGLLPVLRAHVSGQRESSGKLRVSRSCMDDSLQWLANVPAAITDVIILSRANLDVPRILEVTRQDAMVAMLNESFTLSSSPSPAAHACSLQARDVGVFDIISRVIMGVRAYKLEFSENCCDGLPALFEQLLEL